MSDFLPAVLAGAAGGVLGAIFYGGLWWTVNRGLPSKEPAVWFFASMVLRTSLVAAGFYLITKGHWERALFCLAGFVVARLVVSRITRESSEVIHAA